MADFGSAYRRTAIYEGGYANVSGDTGGETYKGISRRYHPHWKGWEIIDEIKKKRSIKHNEIINNDILKNLVVEFYYDNFWIPIKGNNISNQVIAEFLYDYSVHSGLKRAITKIQQAVQVSSDGIIGPKTITAINTRDPKELLKVIKQERINFLVVLSNKPGQQKFRKGWLARVNNFK